MEFDWTVVCSLDRWWVVCRLIRAISYDFNNHNNAAASSSIALLCLSFFLTDSDDIKFITMVVVIMEEHIKYIC